MYLENFLNESTNGFGEEFIVEATNEGLDFQHGGVYQAIALAEANSHALNMAQLGTEVHCVKLISENAREEADMIQENVLTSIFEKIKSIIKKLWARMKEVMSTVTLYFTKLANDKAFITNVTKALKDYSDFSNLEVEGYTFTLDAIDPEDAFSKSVDAANKAFGAIKAMARDNAEDAATKNKPVIEEITKASDADAKDTYVNAGFKFNTKDFANDLFKVFRNGKSDKDKIVFNKAACVNAVNDFKTRKTQAEALTKKVDFIHTQALKDVSDLEKALPKAEDQSTMGVANKVSKSKFSKQAEVIKELLIYANRAVDAKIRAIKDERSQAKTVLLKALGQARKNVREADKNLNASTDLLGSLMNNYGY